MADEDEDLSHLRNPNPDPAADEDPEEETLDYGAAFAKIANSDHALHLPKRGEKDFESHETNLQLSKLDASRLAMHNVLSWQRTHTQKNHIPAMYDPETNMAYVNKPKTSMFLTMGRSKGGKEWLLPEEALFLIERGSVDCRWPAKDEENGGKMLEGAPMSLQAAYAAFLGYEAGVGGKLTMEMYTVYSGLKRSGYVVFRHGSWDDERAPVQSLTPKSPNQNTKKTGYWTSFWSEVWRRISQPSHIISQENPAYAPLFRPGLYRSYADIYRALALIPSYDRSQPPTFTLPPNPNNPFRIHFDVWKTSGSQRFRKSARPPPDFRICVINARETNIPTAAELNDLLATVPDDAPKENATIMNKLKHGERNVLLAVVDNGIPSYIRVADVNFSREKVYERTAPRGGKGGRGGRGGRGRGRGRGR
ncbi:tRNA-splicing endonuclease subunit sen54 [Paraconiothyrium brasiliense]|uniref:tRNA-splicing endonuclease subunit sen54 n=1 Tax=Paraconiothyrium brasiliense TaxID=300254 RepID=A0ABR3RV43_9PLEO